MKKVDKREMFHCGGKRRRAIMQLDRNLFVQEVLEKRGDGNGKGSV